ncbi:MAG TPA: helix-turn-helix domain-containing protein [Candidatus Binataceae bacterium]|nr:helix-turn-helix domain-containing protein [Candidatus Binataceae bacterium]
MKSKETLGNCLKERRLALGFTQRALARLLGVEASHVAFIEGGRRRPSLKLIGRLANTLGLDQQALFGLAHPEAKTLLTPTSYEEPKKTSPSWQRFISDRALLTRYRVTARELQTLQHVNLMGRVSSPQQLLAILMLIRDTSEKE